MGLSITLSAVSLVYSALLISLCILHTMRGSDAGVVSEKWKVAPPGSDVAAWEQRNVHLFAHLAEHVPEALNHTGASAFDEHLKGVQSILRGWGSEEPVADAGLFHSIYGTEGFQGHKISFSERKRIHDAIGPRAERLAWIFCIADRKSVDDLVFSHYADIKASKADASAPRTCTAFTIKARVELGRFDVAFDSEEEWLDFVELSLADWLEQVEGAAERQNDLWEWGIGEAFSHRREAFQCMAKLLEEARSPRLQAAKRMSDEIYAQEGQATRHLHQAVTPPMSPAAREAREAFRSIDSVLG